MQAANLEHGIEICDLTARENPARDPRTWFALRQTQRVELRAFWCPRWR
jgi:hypothetical protein